MLEIYEIGNSSQGVNLVRNREMRLAGRLQSCDQLGFDFDGAETTPISRPLILCCLINNSHRLYLR